ncbi:zinc-finger domain-containing protein [Rhodobacteraceae bacterium]|nr:zinc-finger domain-containing protein [Paracoccaceae bacterium]
MNIDNANNQQPPEIETVSTTRIHCDGGEGPLGHPRVWLSIKEDTGWVECGYCDKRFVLAET